MNDQNALVLKPGQGFRYLGRTALGVMMAATLLWGLNLWGMGAVVALMATPYVLAWILGWIFTRDEGVRWYWGGILVFCMADGGFRFLELPKVLSDPFGVIALAGLMFFEVVFLVFWAFFSLMIRWVLQSRN